jgi:hypothetical protein
MTTEEPGLEFNRPSIGTAVTEYWMLELICHFALEGLKESFSARVRERIMGCENGLFSGLSQFCREWNLLPSSVAVVKDFTVGDLSLGTFFQAQPGGTELKVIAQVPPHSTFLELNRDKLVSLLLYKVDDTFDPESIAPYPLVASHQDITIVLQS